MVIFPNGNSESCKGHLADCAAKAPQQLVELDFPGLRRRRHQRGRTNEMTCDLTAEVTALSRKTSRDTKGRWPPEQIADYVALGKST